LNKGKALAPSSIYNMPALKTLMFVQQASAKHLF